MSEYRIYNDMDTGNIMDCLPESEKIDFVYDCYECLSALNKGDFIESIGVEDVIKLFDDGEIVEHLSDEDLIEELELRGYEITRDE